MPKKSKYMDEAIHKISKISTVILSIAMVMLFALAVLLLDGYSFETLLRLFKAALLVIFVEIFKELYKLFAPIFSKNNKF
ncbi:MAG: hypothetical protein FWD23_15425 [Oscillospiraceae bacterium]|nr:hypothetical protein [Oscillospiraceae bacterium]